MMNIKSHNLIINDESWSVIYPDYCQDISTSSELKQLMTFYIQISSQIQDSRTLDLLDFQAAAYQVMMNWKKRMVCLGSLRFQDELFLQSLVKKTTQEIESSEHLEHLENYKEELSKLGNQGTRYYHPIKKQTHKYKLEDILKGSELEPNAQEYQDFKNQLLVKIGEYQQSFFEKLSDVALNWTAQFKVIRLYLLKFLAILPCLDHDKSGKEVKSILLENLRRLNKQSHELPWYLKLSLKLTGLISLAVPAFILSPIVKAAVRFLAKRFIAGENIDVAKSSIELLKKTKRDITIDQLGELVVSDSEANIYLNKVLDIIKGFSQYYPKGERNSAGILRAHVSIKLSALCAQFNHSDFDFTYNQIAPRLKQIFKLASESKTFVNVDAEHYHSRDIIFEVYKKALKEILDQGIICESGIVVQAYLIDAAEHLNDIKNMSRELNYKITVRLVKGAYWDAETIEASAHSHLPPQFINKVETDLFFRQLCLEILKSSDHLQLTIASHNILDHCWVRSVWKKHFSHTNEIEHQCLHMTYEALSTSMAQMGWATRNYIPIGDLLVGMAYLVRRIMENSSQVGVLQIMRSHKESNLLREPQAIFREENIKGGLQNYKHFLEAAKGFKNITPLRSYLKDHHKVLVSNYKQTIVHSHEIEFDEDKQIEQKIMRAKQAFELQQPWYTDFSLRALALTKLAHELFQKRAMLSAVISHEAGKSLEEALADVDEAIDFINFYLREYKADRKAMGIIAVIAPWNFPLAIPCGMSVAALVAGNSVILKPAEQTPRIMEIFYDMAINQGIPNHAFQLVQGAAKQGELLVSSPVIDSIIFTGSQKVGEYLYREKGLQHQNRHGQIRPVVVEMGGKNPIIVTNNCELDETVSGCLYSCFAHAGQKCSAASRIIVHKKVKENFIKRFIPAAELLKVGSSDDFSTYINPLISKEDFNRVNRQVKRLVKEVEKVGGQVHLNLADSYKDLHRDKGFLCGPVIVEIPAEAAMGKQAFFTQEFFAPIVHIVEYAFPQQAVDLANITDYALTAGLFCQSQDDIDFYVEGLEAGNIYVNRPNTGARVGIEPFGGFKMSGTGPKAGGVNYMNLFYAPLKSKGLRRETGLNQYVEQEHIIHTLKSYFGISKLESKKLAQLFSSIKERQTGYEQNTFVPDQLSYSDYQLTSESISICMDEKKADFEFCSFLISAIASSIKIKLFFDESMSNYWAKLEHENIEHIIQSAQSESMYESHIIVMHEQGLSQFQASLNTEFQKYLPKIFILGQGYEHDFHRIFLTQRSYAINIMRHGAPLQE